MWKIKSYTNAIAAIEQILVCLNDNKNLGFDAVNESEAIQKIFTNKMKKNCQ